MRKEGEEKLSSLGSNLTKIKKNLHKKRATILRNKTDFTGKSLLVRFTQPMTILIEEC